MIIAIDPGDVHVGIAYWEKRRGMRSTELDPIRAADFVEFHIGDCDVLVIEEFRLYASMAQTLVHSEFLTSQLIGVLKWIARKYEVPVMVQGASIKVPTRARCKAKRHQWEGKSIHESDARLHLWHYLERNEIV